MFALSTMGERVPQVGGRARGLAVPSEVENVTLFPTFTMGSSPDLREYGESSRN